MQLDTMLIGLCEVRASGAHFHTVRNALHHYRCLIELAQDDPESQKKAEEIERRLRAFIVTNDVTQLRPSRA